MTALIWILTWVLQVLPAEIKPPKPVNPSMTSESFRHMFKWQPGPGTPTGVHYEVTINTDKGKYWVPVAGCNHVQHPLVCNLTDAMSDPRKSYYVKITARLEKQTSEIIYSDFKPIRDIQLDLPLLTVTPCDRDLCVDLQPPMKHLKEIYNSLSYKLKIRSNGIDRIKDSKSLERCIFNDLAPSRQYCVSVCISDRLESRESNYSQPVCAFTSGIYTADYWISAVLCLLVMIGVVIVALLVVTGFICLKRRPQPVVLMSILHLERVLIIAPCRTSLSSLLTVKPTLASSGEKKSNQSLSDESDGESGTEYAGGSKECYKLQVGTNLLSSSSVSSLSVPLFPKSEPQPSLSENQSSDVLSPQLVPISTETHSSTGSNHKLSTHTDTYNLTAGIIETDKEQNAVGEEDSQDVNLLTLTFGRHEEKEEDLHFDLAQEEPQSHSASEEYKITSVQLTQSLDTKEFAIEAISCSADEEVEEEEEHSGYMGRTCTEVLQNLL